MKPVQNDVTSVVMFLLFYLQNVGWTEVVDSNVTVTHIYITTQEFLISLLHNQVQI